ncbi:MAG TPA: hypothetical protein V6D50_04130, partial [Chroococcales cyanobacterium]
MQKISTLLLTVCLETVLLTGAYRADAALNSLPLAQVTPQQPELEYEGIPLKCYVQAAKAIPSGSEQGNLDRFSLLSGVVEQYLNAGQPDKAIEIATSLESADSGDELLTVLVVQQMLTVTKENARETLRTVFQIAQGIKGKTSRVETFLKIAEAAVQVGQPALALKSLALAEQDAQALEDTYPLIQVAADYIATGQPNPAIPLLSRSEQRVRAMPKADERLSELGWIAGRYAAAGQPEKARVILAPVLKLLNSIEYSNRRNTLLARVTANYASFGERETLPGAMELVRAIADLGQRDWALTRLSESYRAARHYDLALQTANAIQNADRKTDALFEIADGYQAREQKDKASQVLAQAFQFATTIPDVDRQFSALLRLILDYSAFEQTDKVAEVLDRVQPLVTRLPDVAKQFYVLNLLASIYVNIGQKDKAALLIEQALTLANRVEDASTRDDFLSQIANSYTRIDQFDQAVAIANRFQDASTKAKVLNSIAETYLSQQPEKALQVVKLIEPLDPKVANQALTSIAREYARTKQFDQALQVVERIQDNELANWARIAIATEYANAGQVERVLQVADTIQTTMKMDISDRPSNNGTNLADTLLKNQTLAALALLYAQAERFPQALQLVQTIQPDRLKDQVRIAIAKQQAKAGQYSNAIQVANTITDARQRDPLLQLLS